MKRFLRRAAISLLLMVGYSFSGCEPQPAFAQTASLPTQTAVPATATTAPAESTAEQIALATLTEQLRNNQKQHDQLLGLGRQIEAAIRKEHPGFHLDEQTGTIVRDAAAARPAAAPVPKPGVTR